MTKDSKIIVGIKTSTDCDERDGLFRTIGSINIRDIKETKATVVSDDGMISSGYEVNNVHNYNFKIPTKCTMEELISTFELITKNLKDLYVTS